MNVINLTPHPITLHGAEGVIVIPPDSRGPARRAQVAGVAGKVTIPGIGAMATVSAPTMGGVTGLPDPVEGTIYIVSSLVAGGCPDRADVYSPGTGPGQGAVRDADGHVVGVTMLVCAQAAR